jgi:hypothetical protein
VAGELAAHVDAMMLARVVTSGMFAISIRARAGSSRRLLSRIARGLVDLIVPPA